jgi:hypothetical protein
MALRHLAPPSHGARCTLLIAPEGIPIANEKQIFSGTIVALAFANAYRLLRDRLMAGAIANEALFEEIELPAIDEAVYIVYQTKGVRRADPAYEEVFRAAIKVIDRSFDDYRETRRNRS